MRRHGIAIAPGVVLASTELLDVLTDHGINPFAPDSLNRASRAMADYDEEVVSTDPLEASITFTIDGDSLALTLDDDLAVVDVSHRRRGTE